MTINPRRKSLLAQRIVQMMVGTRHDDGFNIFGIFFLDFILNDFWTPLSPNYDFPFGLGFENFFSTVVWILPSA